ncbi:HdeD family acid-resistance protein [Thiolapillus sp.]
MNTENENLPGQSNMDLARENWGWLLAMGILFVLLGSIGLGMTVALTLTSILFLGAFMLVGGVFQLLYTIRESKTKSGKDLTLNILLAILYVVAGIWVMINPALASMLATAMIAGFLSALGVIRIMAAFDKKPDSGWGWLLAAGVMSLILALLIFLQWPISGLWVIGLFIAIEMLFHGWAYVFVALALRKQKKATAPGEKQITA